MRVKEWFRKKNFNEQEAFIISVADLYIEKETEKAYYFKAVSDYGTTYFWCPKSCTQSEAEYEAEQAAAYEKIERGEKYHDLLVKFAKEHGVKGIRKNLRTETLKRKIEEALIKVPSYEELTAEPKEEVKEEIKEEANEIEVGDNVETKKGNAVVVEIKNEFVTVKIEKTGEVTSFLNNAKFVRKLKHRLIQ